ncbi:MAG: hypothetical protein HY821_08550 [Acidobacteria bacterium]|nr:hypothetical protein [Acidobacteriota bacterium]
MRRFILASILILAVMGLMFAQGTKVATATSTAAFKLKGAEVNPAGVPTWPLMAGDTVEALKTPVTLVFEDGSKVSLAPGAKGKVEMQNGKATFVATEGEIYYDMKGVDSVKLMAMDKQVKASQPKGTYCVGCAGKKAGAAGAAGGAAAAAGFWTPATIALVAAGVAGAGIGLGVALSDSGSAPVSPSGSSR